MFDFSCLFQPSVKQTLERSGADVTELEINEAGLNIIIM